MERSKQARGEAARESSRVSQRTIARYKALIALVPDHTFAIPFDQLKERGLFDETVLQERNAYMASEQKLDPFASSPAKPPKCSLRMEWPDTDQMQLRTFRDFWGAKKLFDFLTDFKAVRWLTTTKLVVNETGMVISSPELEQIVEHKLDKKHEQYQWTEPFLSEVTAFKNKTTIKSSKGNDKPKRERDDTPRPTREKKERVPRPSKDGLITIGDIASDMKIEPRIARGILRDTKTPKPDAGWAWAKNEVDAIKTIIKKGLK